MSNCDRRPFSETADQIPTRRPLSTQLFRRRGRGLPVLVNDSSQPFDEGPRRFTTIPRKVACRDHASQPELARIHRSFLQSCSPKKQPCGRGAKSIAPHRALACRDEGQTLGTGRPRTPSQSLAVVVDAKPAFAPNLIALDFAKRITGRTIQRRDMRWWAEDGGTVAARFDRTGDIEPPRRHLRELVRPCTRSLAESQSSCFPFGSRCSYWIRPLIARLPTPTLVPWGKELPWPDLIRDWTAMHTRLHFRHWRHSAIPMRTSLFRQRSCARISWSWTAAYGSRRNCERRMGTLLPLRR
jgi:hypothetical protein